MLEKLWNGVWNTQNNVKWKKILKKTMEIQYKKKHIIHCGGDRYP
jgi:hypothetical protein